MLIIFDLDGTINNGWRLIPPLYIKLMELQLSGHKIVMNTSRDLYGALYYLYHSNFPFELIACAGGVIIQDPLKYNSTQEMIMNSYSVSMYHRQPRSPPKIERIKVIQQIYNMSDEETLFIDDGPQNMTHALTVTCKIATLNCRDETWKQYVRDNNGIVSELDCGHGVLEILEKMNIK